MFTRLTRARLTLLVAGAVALGTVAAAGAAASLGPPPVSSADGFGAVALGPAVGAGALPAIPAADDVAPAPEAANPPARLGRRGSRPGPDAAAAAVDPRLLSLPLAERFTQTTPGASNPGQRRAAGRTPMSSMLAAVLDEGDVGPASGDAPSLPPVDPPPAPGGEDEGGEPGDGGGPAGVPEIDANLLGAGLLLLIGGALVLNSRR